MDSSDEDIIVLSLLCDELSKSRNSYCRNIHGENSDSDTTEKTNDGLSESGPTETNHENVCIIEGNAQSSLQSNQQSSQFAKSGLKPVRRRRANSAAFRNHFYSQTSRIRKKCAEKNVKLKRWWVRPLLQNRTEEGEFYTTFAYLSQHETEFKTRFRMSYRKFTDVLNLISPEIRKKNTMLRDAICPQERLAILLRYLATGDSFVSISSSYRVGISTVQNIVIQTCSAIWNKLGPVVMPAPTTEQWTSIEDDFNIKWGFPNCVGVMDGRSIAVQATNFGKTAVILLALVDANYRFLIIDVGAELERKGGCKILSNSTMGKALEEGTLGLPSDKPLPGTTEPLPHVVIGDKMFPSKGYLLCPYPDDQVQGDNDDGKRIFNGRIAQVRQVADKAFDMLMQRFRFYYKKVQLKPETADTILLATCCLHNFLYDEPLPELDPTMLNTNTEDPALEKLEDVGENTHWESTDMQDKFKDYLVKNNIMKYEVVL